MLTLIHPLTQLIVRLISLLERVFRHLTQPSRYSIVLSTAADLTRRKADLIAENALLRQQLIILQDDQLLAEERISGDEFGFASREVGGNG